MSPRIAPGVLALLLGAIAAVILFVPLVAISYRRNGAMTPLRTLGWLGMLLWILGLWAYTMLPLPASPESIRCTTPQLVPFDTIAHILRIHAQGVPILSNSAFEVRLFNVILFVPFGVIVRWVFGWGWKATLAAGFGLSLAVEMTQLTGTWGVYPCSYRHFDVDDLISNTAGAVLGWAIVHGILGGRRIETRPVAAAHVTATRRLTGMACDLLVVTLVALAAPALTLLLLVGGFGLPLTSVDDIANLGVGTMAALLVQGIVVLATGATIGEHAVLLRGETRGRHVLVSRVIRLMTGIGGYVILFAMPTPIDMLAPALAIATLVAVLASPDRRGLATTLAGMDLADGRTGDANATQVNDL